MLPLRRTGKPIILCHYLEREGGREEIGRKEGGGGRGREGERKGERRREGRRGSGKGRKRET